MTNIRKVKILRAGEIAAASQSFSHPWNPDSQLIGLQLARQGGLERTGSDPARSEPGLRPRRLGGRHRFLRARPW